MTAKKVFVIVALAAIFFVFILSRFYKTEEETEGIVIVITGVPTEHQMLYSELVKFDSTIYKFRDVVWAHTGKNAMEKTLLEECEKFSNLYCSLIDSLSHSKKTMNRTEWYKFSAEKLRKTREDVEKSIKRIQKAAAAKMMPTA
jgi:hypothetical protein